jgi:hypothetical protein
MNAANQDTNTVFDSTKNAFPFEVDELEDNYILQYNVALDFDSTNANPADNCNCCYSPGDISVGDYEPDGFMWFFLNMMYKNKVVKRVTANLEIEYEEKIEFNVYPNPSSQLVNLPEHFKLTIYDIKGTLVKTNYLMPTQINISHLTPGLYLMLIQVSQSEKAIPVKLLIK